jgi:uncharacterized NAD-dependent epimerase/dehydratase family protein
MENGMDIINGLHQFFSEDREFVHVAARNACPNKRHQKTAAIKRFACIHGKKIGVTAPVVAVLGTDCACGKRTTAVELNNTLNVSASSRYWLRQVKVA